MATLPSMITFGSLTPLPSQDQILALHGEFRRKTSLLRPLIEAVRDLPLLWAKMTDQNPALGVLNGEAAIMKSEGLVSGPANEHILDEKHNILIHSEILNHNSVLENVVAMGGVQGLCAGLLSAQAVASAQTVEDVVALSCTSLRLAFCFGAYVDANQVSINGGNDESVTLAVRWDQPKTLEDVKKILLNHPKVYLAAVRDERDITIPAPAEAATTPRDDLSQNGLSFL
ncbi:hypothetical protein F5X98DRAFT_390043 [Xylaria grammica]|nr:hypothetical protein F5X98DRAFT_390043 [Xylaria grammica]